MWKLVLLRKGFLGKVEASRPPVLFLGSEPCPAILSGTRLA